MRSSSDSPVPWYRLAIDTTSRRFDWMNVRLATSAAVTWAVSAVLRARVGVPSASSISAALPSSMARASVTSCSALRSG